MRRYFDAVDCGDRPACSIGPIYRCIIRALGKCSFHPDVHTGQLNLTATEVNSQPVQNLFRRSVAIPSAFALAHAFFRCRR
jgi:hypothetical protein